MLPPLAQCLQKLLILHDQVEVQPQEDCHPRLGQLVVAAGDESAGKCTDEVQEFVGGFVAVADGERAQFQVGRCGREGFEMLDEVGV